MIPGTLLQSNKTSLRTRRTRHLTPDSRCKTLEINNKASEAHHNVLKCCQNKNLMVAFQPSQPVEAPSLGYGAPLADPLTVYTSPNQVGFRLLMPLLMSLQANLDLSNV